MHAVTAGVQEGGHGDLAGGGGGEGGNDSGEYDEGTVSEGLTQLLRCQ
jgi:hypothetical protein